MSPALKEKDGEFLFDEAIRHFKESNDCAQQQWMRGIWKERKLMEMEEKQIIH